MNTLLHVFPDAELIPAAWSTQQGRDCYFFNPAITRFHDQVLMAYRVVTQDGRRRIALCRLSQDLHIVAGSVVPFSDSIQAGGDWHADARFCSFQDRLFVHYNDGFRKPNHIYLVEVDPDTLMARGPARELVLDGPRRVVEKNWMLFAYDDALWAVYSICPHVVLKVELAGTGPIVCRPVYHQTWEVASYADRFGELRGGAPPVRVGDQYISIFHSRFQVRPLRRLLFRLLRKRPSATIRYVGGAYGFAAEPPFTPLWLRPTPLILPPTLPRRRKQLDRRVERSAYVCGAFLQDREWIVTYGAQEEYCCLTKIDANAMLAESYGQTQELAVDTEAAFVPVGSSFVQQIGSQ